MVLKESSKITTSFNYCKLLHDLQVRLILARIFTSIAQLMISITACFFISHFEAMLIGLFMQGKEINIIS